MVRRIVAAIILVPLALLLVMFAVANRQTVVVSFDPFNETHPALVLALPLFALALVLIAGGVIIGGLAAWLGQGKWRRAARLTQREVRELKLEARALKAEVESLRHRLPEFRSEPMQVARSPSLRIAPPAA